MGSETYLSTGLPVFGSYNCLYRTKIPRNSIYSMHHSINPSPLSKQSEIRPPAHRRAAREIFRLIFFSPTFDETKTETHPFVFWSTCIIQR